MTKSATTGLVLGICGLLAGLSPPATAKGSKCHPGRWADAMASFQKTDKADPPPKGGIVFVGSSSIRLWDLPKSFPGLPAINRGFGGSELCDSVHHFDLLVERYKPRSVVLYAGDNDIAAGRKADEVYADFREFAQLMTEKLPESRLVFISIKPSPSRWKHADEMQKANAKIAEACESDPERLEFVDVWPQMLGPDGKPRQELYRDDDLHMNDEGYAIWAALLADQLQPLEAATP